MYINTGTRLLIRITGTITWLIEVTSMLTMSPDVGVPPFGETTSYEVRKQ